MQNLLNNLISQIPSLLLTGFFWQYLHDRLKDIKEQDRRITRLEIRDEILKELRKP